MRRSSEEIVEALQEFVGRWWLYAGTEKSAAQTFLNELVGCYTGLPNVIAAGANFEEFGPTDDGSGYMDLYWPGKVILEMKRPSLSDKLAEARGQAIGYWRNTGDPVAGTPAPRFLVLCAFHTFEVWEPGRYPTAPVDTFTLKELPDRHGALLFLAGDEPMFGSAGQDLTRAAAATMADLYFTLADRNAAPAAVLRSFVLQTVWCMFAEDLTTPLLPNRPITRIVRALLKDPSRSSAAELGHLFVVLNHLERAGERGGIYESMPYANGGLFAEPALVHLLPEELGRLSLACDYDWAKINPTIFGSLMEGCIGATRRSALGAHFTYEADIMRIVRPVIVEPWTSRIKAAATPAEALEVLEQLCRYRVLDPACGSGNFLYVAYRELRELEHQAKEKVKRLHTDTGMAGPTGLPGYPLGNMHGIDIDEFAVLIARVTLWMGHKLAADKYGVVEPVLPLADLGTIRRDDALNVNWPEVEAIVGNPPFHGTKQMRSALGDDYVNRLIADFKVGVKDYCVYWFRKAHEHLGPGQRAGLVATNSVAEGKNREAALDYIVEQGGVITDAVSTQDWPGDAQVSVSIVNWVKQPPAPPAGYRLDGQDVAGITTSLRAGAQQAEPANLTANSGRQFFGIVPSSNGFVLPEAEAHALILRTDNDYTRVVCRYLIGEDIADRPALDPGRWIINFGEMPLEKAQRYPAALNIVRARVKPQRDLHAKRREREEWWKPSRSAQSTLTAISTISRYIACGATAKRFYMVWCDKTWCPSNLTSVFAFDDDYSFGVLASKIHTTWARMVSTRLELRPRYTTRSFASFPWPGPTAPQADAVAAAGLQMLAERTRVQKEQGLGLTVLYNQMEQGAYVGLRKRHEALDRAVAACYGWGSEVLASQETIYAAVHAVNAAVAAGRAYRPFEPLVVNDEPDQLSLMG